jgi:hypothetical protein
VYLGRDAVKRVMNGLNNFSFNTSFIHGSMRQFELLRHELLKSDIFVLHCVECSLCVVLYEKSCKIVFLPADPEFGIDEIGNFHKSIQ